MNIYPALYPRVNKYISILTLIIIFLGLYIPTGSTKTYYTGPKGGCYYITSSGNKLYVSHEYCGRDDEGYNGVYNKTTNKTYYTGPKGGCFYYGEAWKKNYVSHTYCYN